MQVMEAGLDKSMVSYLPRHQDPCIVDHYAEFQSNPLKGALDKGQGFNGFDEKDGVRNRLRASPLPFPSSRVWKF